MFNFIKWELRDFFKKNIKMGIVVIAILLITLITPLDYDNQAGIFLIWVPFWFMMFYLIFSMFIKGTLVIINTYKNKTFLLESMVSYSPSKLLLAKYLMAIIIDIIYGVILFVVVAIFVSKFGEVNLAEELLGAFSKIPVLQMLKYVSLLCISAVMFTSLIVMVYIISKCINPSKKGTFITGVIVWWVVTYLQSLITNAIAGTEEIMIEPGLTNTYFFTVLGIDILFIVIYYFVTVKLIKDKLEIYS